MDLLSYLAWLLSPHVLILARNNLSEKIAFEKYGIDMRILKDCQDCFSPVGRYIQLQEFPVYSSRLEMIQRQMKDWRPEMVSSLRRGCTMIPLRCIRFGLLAS